MVSSTRHAIACILLIFGSAVYVHSQTGVAAKGPTASISGKVTIKGKGVAGIVVGMRLVDSSYQQSRGYKAFTDDQGNYKIINVPPGHYQVLAVAPVFVSHGDPSRWKTLLISKDETVENIDFELVRGGVITGKVTDAEGRPVIEEEVLVYSVQQSNRPFNMMLGGRTDDRGIYRIFGLPPGKYRVAAGQNSENSFGRRMDNAFYKLTYHTAATDPSQAAIIEVTEGGEVINIDITLSRALVKYSALGRIVHGDTGRPLSNVKYGIQMSISENHSVSMTTGAVSNSEGEFKLENLAPGKYTVFVEASSDSEWQAEPVRFEVIDQDVKGLVIKTSKSASVSGVLVLESTDDKAIHANFRKERLYANVSDEILHTGSNHSSSINQDGTFRIGALRGGRLDFSLSNASFQIVRVEREGIVYPKGFELKEGEQLSGFRIIVNHGNETVRGVVTLEGGTLPPNGMVYLSLKRLGGDAETSTERSARLDARGQFLVDGLIPGSYEVSAAVYVPGTRGPVPRTKQQVVVTDGTATNITLTINLTSTPNRP